VGVNAAGSNQTPFVSATNAVYFNPSTGTLFAVAKSFRIPHPTKTGKMLVYGVLEGPENGVYVRGRLTGSNTIALPEYWTKLVDPDSITVNLTPIGNFQQVYVENITDNVVYIGSENAIDCFFTVWAERVDIDKLVVETERNGD
jgi:hypothetical protein